MATNAGSSGARRARASSSALADSGVRGGQSSKETNPRLPILSATVGIDAGYRWPGAASRLPRVHRLDLGRVLLADRLALELHRRRQLVAAREPVARQDRELLDLLDARELDVGGLDALADGGEHALVGGERLERDVLDALLLSPGRGEVAVEDDQGGVVRPGVADAARLADERARRLQRRLDVGRRHVLAGRADDELLLAVDDAHVAVLVDLGDVAGVQPAVRVDRLPRELWLVAVAQHDDPAAHEQLAVFAEVELDVRRRRADRPDLDAPRRVDRAGAAGLRHPPQLGERHADRVEELDHLDRGRGRADVDRLDGVEAEHLAQAREDLLVGPRDAGGEVVGNLLPALLEAHLLQRVPEGRLDRRPLLLG